MKKKLWQKLFWLFVAGAFGFSVVVSGLFSLFFVGEGGNLPFLSLFFTHLMSFLPLFFIFALFLFVCVFLYCRSVVLAGDFLFKLFYPQSNLSQERQKKLFYLAHTKNPYLKSIRFALNPLLSKTKQEEEKDSKISELTFSDIVSKALHQSQSRYPTVKIASDLKADIKLPFYADTMFQVLWELIKNAKQASPINETIHIRTYTKDTNWFCCEVEDRGPGMSRDLMEKSSKLYWTTKKGSTGLGLAFVQSALSRIGGIMKLQSLINKGGFKVLLFIPKDYLFHIQNSLSFSALDYEKALSHSN